jgi:hypothetical protein
MDEKIHCDHIPEAGMVHDIDRRSFRIEGDVTEQMDAMKEFPQRESAIPVEPALDEEIWFCRQHAGMLPVAGRSCRLSGKIFHASSGGFQSS